MGPSSFAVVFYEIYLFTQLPNGEDLLVGSLLEVQFSLQCAHMALGRSGWPFFSVVVVLVVCPRSGHFHQSDSFLMLIALH